MNRLNKILPAATLVVALIASPLVPAARGSRSDQVNSLTDCIAKADVIVIGIVRAREENEKEGVLTVQVLRVFKGTVEPKEIRVADPFFRSTFRGSPEGPVVVKDGEGYVFFLKSAAEGERRRLFNSYDGVVPRSGPVDEEIAQQLKRK